MRTTGAVLLVIGIAFVGFTMVSYGGQSVQDAAVTNGTNASEDVFNLNKNIQSGVGQTMVQALTWGGLAAIVLGTVGYLVVVGPRGR